MIDIRWNKMQRAVSMVSCAMFASFWMALCWPDLWWLGALMVIYQGQNFWANAKADMADERAQLIAARAGWLSQQLVMGAAIMLFAFNDKRHLSGTNILVTLLLVSVVTEGIFRKMLGAEPRRADGAARVVVAVLAIVLVAMAAGLAYVFWFL
jgi:hypothetical protein